MPKAHLSKTLSRIPQIAQLVAHRREILSYLFISIVVAATYLPSLGNSFVHYDDYAYIHQNPIVSVASWPRAIHSALVTHHEQNYVPALWLTFRSIFQTSGDSPFSFHLISLIAHILVTCLVVNLGKKLNIPYPLCLFGALLWAIHPQRVEAVSWASSLKDPASSLLCLITISFWLQGLKENPKKHQMPTWGWGICITSFLIALCYKQTHALLPFALIGWRALVGEKLPLKGRIAELILCFLGITALALAKWANTGATPHGDYLGFSNLMDQIPHALSSLGWSTFKFFLPLKLLPNYPAPSNPLPWVVFGALLTLGFFSTLTFAFRCSKHQLLLLPLISIALWFPVSGLIPTTLEFTADRLTYLPSAILILGLLKALSKKVDLRFTSSALLACSLVCLPLCLTQQRMWKNDQLLFSTSLTFNSRHYPSLVNSATLSARSQDLSAAKASLRKAIQFYPNRSPAYEKLVRVDMIQGNPQDALVVAENWANSLKQDPTPHYYQATILAQLRRIHDAQAANREAIKRAPHSQLLENQRKKLNSLKQGPLQ